MNNQYAGAQIGRVTTATSLSDCPTNHQDLITHAVNRLQSAASELETLAAIVSGAPCPAIGAGNVSPIGSPPLGQFLEAMPAMLDAVTDNLHSQISNLRAQLRS